MQSQERTLIIKTSTILKLAGLALTMWFVWVVRDILMLLVISLLLAGMLHPAVRWGDQYKIPKGVMVVLIYIVSFLVMAFSFALIIPTLVAQLGTLSQTIGSSIVTLSGNVRSFQDLLSTYGFGPNFSAGVASIQDQVSQITGGFLSALTNVFGGIASLGIVLVMAFYMVVQDEEARMLFKNFVPDPYQNISAQILRQVEEKIGRWLTGQLLLSLIIGVMYYIGLLILGVDSPVALAFFAAFTELIPYLGPVIGGIPIVIISFGVSPVKALFALGLVILVQQFENQIVVPKVMQRAVGLNPLISILAVLVGAQLFGILGVLLAIPIATTVSVLLTEVYHFRKDEQDI